MSFARVSGTSGRDDQRAHADAKGPGIAVHAADHVGEGLAQGDEKTKELLRSKEELSILFQTPGALEIKRGRSRQARWSTSMIRDPASSCTTHPAQCFKRN